jgi:glycosyltransferase involved in cell wall biosynthesis
VRAPASPIKLLVVIPALGPAYGGPSKSVVEMVEARSSHPQIDLDIVTTNADGKANLEVPLRQWVDKGKYRVQYFPRWKRDEYKFSFSLTAWLLKHVRDYDIVHTNSVFCYPVVVAWWACQLKKVPYIITPHGMLEPWALAYKAWKKNIHVTLVEKRAFKKAHAIQALTSTEAHNIASLGIKTKLVKVPNGINPDEFERLPDPEVFYRQFPSTRGKRIIMFLGRIDPKKGLDILAEAFSRVNKVYPNTHLVIAGPDIAGFLPNARGYFEKSGCLEAVTFTGMLTGVLKHAALSASYLFVAPSYSEGFSMSILEGMGSGLPCIFTKECNFPEAAEAKAATIISPNSEELFKAMVGLLESPAQAKEMGLRARSLIRHNYTWEQSALKLIRMYKEIRESTAAR